MRFAVSVTLFAILACNKLGATDEIGNVAAADRVQTNQNQVPAAVAPTQAAAARGAGESACKQLAQATRDCAAGKPCQQAEPIAIEACSALLDAKGLKQNPY